LIDSGAAASAFEIQEAQGEPFKPGSRPPYKRRIKVYWDPTETAPVTKLSAILNASPDTWGTGSPIPTGDRYRAAGVSCNGQSYYVFGGQTGTGTVLNEAWQYIPVSDSWVALAPMPVALMNMDATCINGYIYLVGGYTGAAHTNNFQIYNTADNTWIATTWPNIRTPMTAAWNGLLFAFGGNPGPSGDTWKYDPGTGVWTGPLAPMPTPESYGAATTVGDYIFYVGGGSVGTDVQRYDPANNTWDVTGPALPALRMNAIAVWYGDKLYVASGGGAGGDLWTAWNNTLILDPSVWPAGSWVDQGEVVPTPVVGAAYDCAKNRIYAGGGTSATTYYATNQYLDDGQTCHFKPFDVPWLSESPITGTVGADSFFDVSVTFNSMTYTVGTYTATLKVKTDDPMTPTINVPVAMHVVAPVYGVVISGNMSQTARPGAVVTYTVSVTNISNGPVDTYNMTLGTHTWTTTIDKATVGPLAQGASAQVKVTVHIPAGAAGGAFDAVQVTATSQHDPTKHATTTLTTTVYMMKIYLPIITKDFHS
jgi:N-acetylneuraminic acid mutarotase